MKTLLAREGSPIPMGWTWSMRCGRELSGISKVDFDVLCRRVLASLPGEVFVLDNRGNILMRNPKESASSKAFALLENARIGDNYFTLLSSQHSGKESHSVNDAIQAVVRGKTLEGFIEYVHDDAEAQEWIEVRAWPLQGPGDGAFVIHVNVTARKRSEWLARQHFEAACHSNRLTTMGELAAALAHEVKQPLAAILSTAEAMMRYLDKAGIKDAEIREAFADVAIDARRADAIIQNVRSSLRKQKVPRTRLSINQVIADAMKLLTLRAHSKHSSIQLDLAHSLSAIEADPIQIQQVLINLAINGMDAMEALPMEQRLLDFRTSAAKDGRFVRMEVSDRGKGVANADLPLLFEPFHSTKPEGLGMGLAISRSIVEAAGGTIRAERRPGGGMTFIVDLPSCDGHVEEPDI